MLRVGSKPMRLPQSCINNMDTSFSTPTSTATPFNLGAAPVAFGNPSATSTLFPTGPKPPLTAQVTTPVSQTKPAPTVLNSQDAEDHLTNVGTQISNLNNDVQNQAAAKNTPSTETGAEDTPPTETPPTQTSDTTQPDAGAQLDSQINDILGNLSEGEKSIDNAESSATTTNNEGQTTTFADAEAENQAQEAQQYQTYAGMLSSISSGTYPLSAPEQQLLSSTQNQFSQAIAAQQTANQAYTGQMAETMASLGISTSAPVQAMGNIYGAISTGQSKISGLETQMAQSLANLQLGFQKQDYDMVQTEWDNLSKHFEDRQAALTTMQKSVTDALNQQKSDLIDYAKTAIGAIQNSAQFTATQKQDAVDNLLKSQTLTETERHNLVDESQKQQTINLQAIAQGSGAGANAPSVSVTMNGDGTVNAAQQGAFLAQLPPDVATLVQGIANYSINPNAIPTKQYKGAAGLTQAQVLSLVSQYDPTYSESDYANRQALVKNFTSGTYSQNINALNTAVGHIADLTDNFSGLGNGGFTPGNAVKNTLASVFGSGAPGKAALNINAATGELAAVFKKSGATDTEISNLGTLNANSSPDQVKQYQEAASQLLASRLSALEDTYSAGMGKAPTKGFLSPDSQNALLKLQQQGLDIKVPELAKAPTVQLQTFHDADPDNAALIDSLVQADPTLKNDPSRMVSLLQNQGYLQ